MSKEHSQWVKPDLPAVVRAPQIFLFGLKKMLIDWNFNKGVIKVDTDMNTLVVDGKRVVQVSVHENMMHYVWAEEWRNWPEFQEDQNVQNLKERVSKMVAGSGKGKGKQKG